MWSSIRTAFVWLVMLAIPLQGIAASAMLHCGPGHERQMVQASATDRDGGHREVGSADHHPAGDHQPDHVDAAAADVASTDHGQPSAQADEVQLVKFKFKFKCSACAQCCASVALLDRVSDPIRFEPVSIAPVMAVDDYPQVAQTGPERPPRSFLA